MERVILNDTLQTIVDPVFEKNNLTDVNIRDSVTSFGTHVFADNGIFVNVKTTNSNISKVENNREAYGHVVGAIRLQVSFINKNTGDELKPSKSIGVNLKDPDAIFVVVGKEFVYKPEELSGYVAEPVPDHDLYDLQVLYLPTITPSIIEQVKKHKFNQIHQLIKWKVSGREGTSGY